MDRAIDFIKGIERKELIQKLISAEFAFAQWRMPQSKQEVLIVSLRKPLRVSTEISNLDTGFLVNKFQDNHPGNPYFIKADLIFESKTIQIDPRVNSPELEDFETRLQSAPSINIKASEEVNFKGSSEFQSQVSLAVRKIRDGNMDKVVLSRYKDVRLPVDFSPETFFHSISQKYPNAFCNLFFIPNEGLWIGATPELLLAENDLGFKTHALAGTKPLDESQDLSEIPWTQKEIEEQAMVSRYIIDCFKKIRLREFKEVGPKSVKAGNLAHLKTTYEVDYSDVSFENLADQMLELLHPTSAVCGTPMKKALEFICQVESFDRSFYSGFLGPVHFKESTDLFVNLRCMRIDHNSARLFAGAGITSDSDPGKEWKETEMKMNTLHSLFSQ